MLQLSLDLSVISGRCNLAPNSGINDLLWWWLDCSLLILDVQRITLWKLLVNINYIFTKYRERGKWPNSVCDNSDLSFNSCSWAHKLGLWWICYRICSHSCGQNYILHRPSDSDAAATDIFAAYFCAHSLIFSPRYLPRWNLALSIFLFSSLLFLYLPARVCLFILLCLPLCILPRVCIQFIRTFNMLASSLNTVITVTLFLLWTTV